MLTMIFISSVAIFVGIVGCIVIWGMDAMRADEIAMPKAAPAEVAALEAARRDTRAIDG